MSVKKMSDTEREELEFIKLLVSSHNYLLGITLNERVAVLYEMTRNDGTKLRIIQYSDLVLEKSETYNEQWDVKKFNKLLSWMESEA